VAESSRDQWLQYKHNITEKQYNTILGQQRGVCAVCQKRSNQHLSVDRTGDVVHGLLCIRCATGLSMFGRDVRLVAAAIVYLQDSGHEFAVSKDETW
jgi:hypothetical protein